MNEEQPTLRILIVDDEVENLKALRRELHRWALEHNGALDICESGEAALEHFAEHPYAVLLTDNRMPGMNGSELVQRVGHDYPDTVSIILTGYTEKEDVAAALSAGIFSFMVKPWDKDELKDELERAVAVHEARRTRRKESQKIDEERRMAVEFQRHVLTVSAPDIAGPVTPTFARRGTGPRDVSSDYLDFIPLKNGRFFVLIGDVAGTGLRTTFVAAILKTVLVPQFMEQYPDQVVPSRLLAWLNTRLYGILEPFPDLFVSFLVGLVDGAAGTVTCASAGNPLPLVHANHVVRPVEAYGVVLGINEHAVYEDVTVQLSPGDALYLFTDGVRLRKDGTDRANRDDLFQALMETRHSEPVDTVLQRLQNAADVTAEDDIHDDITIVRLLAD